MQFRRIGNKTQVLSYQGYNKEKRRAEVRLLGSYDMTYFIVGKELADNLTDDERSEVERRITADRFERDDAQRQQQLRSITKNINEVTNSLTMDKYKRQVGEEKAQEMLAAMDGLTKQLRNLGYRRRPKTVTVA